MATDRTSETRKDMEVFAEYLKEAAATVRSWPEWKRTILGKPMDMAETSPSSRNSCESPSANSHT